MIRLRVSDLDQWVKFVEPAHENFELSLDDFLAQMRRESPPTDDMRAGNAFHAALERVAKGGVVDAIFGVEQDGFTFRFEGDFDLPLPAEREPEIVETVYLTLAGPVLLRGRIDERTPGNVIVDDKLSSSFDAERYASSLQWRAYLDMDAEGARHFVYRVWESKRKATEVTIHALHELHLWAYPEMHAEVCARVGQLAEFVAQHVPSLVVPEPATTP